MSEPRGSVWAENTPLPTAVSSAGPEVPPPLPIIPDSRKNGVTGIRFSSELHEALTNAAAERDISVNKLVNMAVADFLPRLIPVEELRWTKP